MLSALWLILQNTLTQFVIFFGVFIIFGLALTLLSRWTNNVFRQFRYPNFGLYAFGIVGIPVHEFCHALFCKLFFHDVKKIKWFDPKGRGGSHGSVTHYYNPKNPYQGIGHFFIGFGPVLLGPVILAALYFWLVPGAKLVYPGQAASLWHHATGFFKAMFSTINLASPGFYLFLYLGISISSQMELSPEDFKTARGGLLPILLILLAINLVAHLFGIDVQTKAKLLGLSLMTYLALFFAFTTLMAAFNLLICTLLMGGINRLLGYELPNPFRTT